MLSRFAVVVCALLISAPAFGQIIYESVTSQYSIGRSDQHYYYGGSKPVVHAYAQATYYCQPYRFGYAGNIHSFDGGNSFGQPSPMYYHAPVYTDCVGGGLTDVSYFGWNAVDAQNEANANAATYFRKSDLLASAVLGADGALHVPASAPQTQVGPVYGQSGAAVSSAGTMRTMTPSRGQIIIIPKNLLDRPLKDFMKKPLKVASAK